MRAPIVQVPLSADTFDPQNVVMMRLLRALKCLRAIRCLFRNKGEETGDEMIDTFFVGGGRVWEETREI